MEVRSHLTACLEKCGTPVELVFTDSKCLDCGVVSDERLMPLHCHMQSHRIHVEEVKKGHPGKVEPHHKGETEAVHKGTLRKLW